MAEAWDHALRAARELKEAVGELAPGSLGVGWATWLMGRVGGLGVMELSDSHRLESRPAGLVAPEHVNVDFGSVRRPLCLRALAHWHITIEATPWLTTAHQRKCQIGQCDGPICHFRLGEETHFRRFPLLPPPEGN